MCGPAVGPAAWTPECFSHLGSCAGHRVATPAAETRSTAERWGVSDDVTAECAALRSGPDYAQPLNAARSPWAYSRICNSDTAVFNPPLKDTVWTRWTNDGSDLLQWETSRCASFSQERKAVVSCVTPLDEAWLGFRNAGGTWRKFGWHARTRIHTEQVDRGDFQWMISRFLCKSSSLERRNLD